MRLRIAALPIALLLAASWPAFAREPPHEHAAHPVAPAVASTARFQSDAPLRREMAALRAAFAAQLPAVRSGRLDAAGYASLGREVDARVATMIRECRLPEDADGVLHGYIGKMLTAAARLKDPQLPASAHRDAVAEVVAAYNGYGRSFIDPGFATLVP